MFIIFVVNYEKYLLIFNQDIFLTSLNTIFVKIVKIYIIILFICILINY